jgi:hypothetical protein
MAELPKLERSIQIVEENGTATYTYHMFWQTFVKTLAQILTTLEENVDAIEEALEAAGIALDAAETAQAAAEAAQTAADTANTAAETAQDAVTEATNSASLLNSGTNNCVLTATDAGTDASITISAHDRFYADGTTVGVNGGTVTGLSYTTLYFIYYSDPSRAGGAVSYVATTNSNDAAQLGDVHYVGSIMTPAAAASNTSGSPNPAPGIRYASSI